MRVARSMLDAEDDERMIWMDTLVMNEDARVLLGIRPVVQPTSNIKENFVTGDRHMAHYRESLKAWQAKGWRINQDEVDRNRNTVAYAIPCPDRRLSKNWTLDPVPLQTAATVSNISKVAK